MTPCLAAGKLAAMRTRVLWFIIGMLTSISHGQQFEELTLEKVRSWPEYQQALVDPTLRPPKKDNEITEPDWAYNHRAMTSEVEQILNRFGIKNHGPIEFSNDNSVKYEITKDIFFSGYFDTSNRFFEVSICLPGLRESFAAATDIESFYEQAVAVYQKAYGHPPIGTPLFNREPECVIWQASIAGVTCKSQGAVTIERDGSNRIRIDRCASLDELNQLREELIKRPVNFSKRQAIALTVKNWQALTKLESKMEKFPAAVRQGYYSPATMEPQMKFFHPDVHIDGVSFTLLNFNHLWLPNSKQKKYHPDGYYYHVALQGDDMFEVHALINWTTGKIVRLNEREWAW
ncbi:MAG: hypothetical protein P1V20_23185 [Verrucomicrobiales bacterium]|nr:hypothetical protein [Verrucomicrobiales bacterium]